MADILNLESTLAEAKEVKFPNGKSFEVVEMTVGQAIKAKEFYTKYQGALNGTSDGEESLVELMVEFIKLHIPELDDETIHATKVAHLEAIMNFINDIDVESEEKAKA